MKNETQKHRKAFEYYYSLGDKRNCTLVANYFSMSERSVHYWKVEFEWQKRIAELDTEMYEALKKKLKNQYVKDKETHYFILNQIIENYRIDLEEGRTNVSGELFLKTLERMEKMTGDSNSEKVALNIQTEQKVIFELVDKSVVKDLQDE